MAEDTLDVRDLIERFEELELERNELDANWPGELDDPAQQAVRAAWDKSDKGQELARISGLLHDLRDCGGDEQWRGDWYPLQLVAEHYFEEHAMQLADDIGAIPANAAWPMTCIDWERAARELKYDYSAVDFDGTTYWYRGC